MKKLIVILLCLSLLLACVPTPEEDAVRQKDTNVLIENVLLTQEQQAESGVTLPPVKTQFPERFVCKETTEIRGVHVVADVPIEILTDSVFPVLRVERMTLSDEQRLTVYKRLFEKETVYLFEEHFSRETLAKLIAMYMEEVPPEAKEEWMREEHGTEEEWQAKMEHRKAKAQEYQEMYNELSPDAEQVPLLPWDGSRPSLDNRFLYVVGDPYDQEGIYQLWHGMVAWTADDAIDFEPPWLDADTNPTGAQCFQPTWKDGSERIDPSAYDTLHAGATVTPRFVAEKAMSYIDGIADYVIADVYWAHNGALDGDDRKTGIFNYLVELVPNCGDAGMLYVNSTQYADESEMTDGYADTWYYPRITASFSPDGKLNGLVWKGSQKITGIVSETTTLLPFDEIQKILVQLINRRFVDERHSDATLTITRVQLGLFRIREKNNLESGLLVPVWAFSTDWYDPDHMQPHDLYLVINAIDGTVIDIDKGY